MAFSGGIEPQVLLGGLTEEELRQQYLRLDGTNDLEVMPTVGGTPVVESGSNSDGEWTRWADGTQQCWHRIAGYDGGSGGIPWTFPIAFLDSTNVPSVAIVRSGTWSSATPLISDTTDSSTKVFKYNDTASTNTGPSNFLNYNLFWEAVGRWK